MEQPTIADVCDLSAFEDLVYNQELDSQFDHEHAVFDEVEPAEAVRCKACSDVMPVRSTNGLCRWCERKAVQAQLRKHAWMGAFIRL